MIEEQLVKLLDHINASINVAGLKLSDYGEAEVISRWNKSEANGGYSAYWRNL